MPDYYNHLGNTYIKHNKIKGGIKTLKSNSEANPKSPEYLTSLANAYYKNSQLEKAKVTYQEALRLGLSTNSRPWYINQLKANASKMVEK